LRTIFYSDDRIILFYNVICIHISFTSQFSVAGKGYYKITSLLFMKYVCNLTGVWNSDSENEYFWKVGSRRLLNKQCHTLPWRSNIHSISWWTVSHVIMLISYICARRRRTVECVRCISRCIGVNCLKLPVLWWIIGNE
jgi:hypothetical protein